MANNGYSELSIGGQKVFFDPDTFSFDTKSHTSVVPSLSGALFFHYIESDDARPNAAQELSLSGVFETEGAIKEFSKMLTKKSPIDVSFNPSVASIGIDPVVTNGKFVMTSFSYSPIKPGLPIPSSDFNGAGLPPVTIRFSYSMTLVRISTK